MLDRVVREHLEGLELAHRGEWRPWEPLAPRSAGVEIVAARTAAGANGGARFFLAWLHDARNGSDPCAHAPTREVAPFVLDLGDLGGGEAAGRRWKLAIGGEVIK